MGGGEERRGETATPGSGGAFRRGFALFVTPVSSLPLTKKAKMPFQGRPVEVYFPADPFHLLKLDQACCILQWFSTSFLKPVTHLGCVKADLYSLGKSWNELERDGANTRGGPSGKSRWRHPCNFAWKRERWTTEARIRNNYTFLYLFQVALHSRTEPPYAKAIFSKYR